jgi:hypothetical protein
MSQNPAIMQVYKMNIEPSDLGVAPSARARCADRAVSPSTSPASSLSVVRHGLTLPAAELCGVNHGGVASLEDARIA